MVFPELWDALAVLPCLQLNSPFFTGFTSYRPHLQTEGKAKGSHDLFEPRRRECRNERT